MSGPMKERINYSWDSAAAPPQVSGWTASPGRRPVRPAPDRRRRTALLATKRGDLIFDAKLLPFKFRDYDVVGVRSVFFFVDEIFEFSMLGPQCIHVLCHGHARPSDQ